MNQESNVYISSRFRILAFLDLKMMAILDQTKGLLNEILTYVIFNIEAELILYQGLKYILKMFEFHTQLKLHMLSILLTHHFCHVQLLPNYLLSWC